MKVDDFSIGKGERVLLLGESGTGKSTLLSLICGIVAPNSGSIIVDGTELTRLSSGARDRFRAERIGVIFQMFNLLPYATPLDNVLLPLSFAPARRGRLGKDPVEAALSLTSLLGLPEDLVRCAAASELSVGQQQRVAAARALLGAPPLVIADEPTSSLDASAQGAFLEILFAQAAATGVTLLMVSHDERLASRFDRQIDLRSVASVAREKSA
jgi:putative ABC transport system ATP-binding protein